MSDALTLEKIVTEAQNLPYEDRLRLVESIVHSLQSEKSGYKKTKTKRTDADFKKVFGIWKNQDISLVSIREKAWKRK